jgi:hydrogenase maturation protein HypF
MHRKGKIIVRGIVQGVGFRPFVFARSAELGITGTVKNLGSEVEIIAFGDRFEEFLAAVSRGPPLARIDSVAVHDVAGPAPEDFRILSSGKGALSGFIPADVAICDECRSDIRRPGGRYEGYWATSCVNCGPRYSIIGGLPYDREQTTMDDFPMCAACREEYSDPASRRHHAQTIACARCGPSLSLLDGEGTVLESRDPIREAARLLDAGAIMAVRGVGGFHIACIEPSARELKHRLGRSEQPLAVMTTLAHAKAICDVSGEERAMLTGPEHPIVVLKKRDVFAHEDISNLHTLGCMLPYTGLHELLFDALDHPLLIMTSANAPGYPMITDLDHAMAHLHGVVDYVLTHDRVILNRCDDSVVRDGYLIRLSRGFAPRRQAIDLGDHCILGVGPELNANISIYRSGFLITSPHVGNVRNPPTLAYLKETAEKIGRLVGAEYDFIAHDLHPRFLSTRYAQALARECGGGLVAVQHHEAHIAATTEEPCIGIAIDGVGYGRDGTIWGGEIFAGEVPSFDRVAHLEAVPMPGGDLATRYPERMLYGILPEEATRDLLLGRGWTATEADVIAHQVEREFNAPLTSSTGRVLDAAAALLGICRERTYDGEPAMKLETAAARGRPEDWDLVFERKDGAEIFSTRALLRSAQEVLGRRPREDVAASVQHNLARGIARMAIDAAHTAGYPRVALSGGVAYNFAIRETIRREVERQDLAFVTNPALPLGDGCISFGQCVMAGRLAEE